jgi:hypothetical protein
MTNNDIVLPDTPCNPVTFTQGEWTVRVYMSQTKSARFNVTATHPSGRVGINRQDLTPDAVQCFDAASFYMQRSA